MNIVEREANAGFDGEYSDPSGSPDQFAVVLAANGDVVGATPLAGGVPGSFSMDVTRFQSDLNLAVAVNIKRKKNLGLPPMSQATYYLTTANEYSERTRILALDGERLALDDNDLLEWLINAEKRMLLGTDNHPVFETSLEDTACSIRRLPNGQISMTEVPRHHIQALGAKVRSLAGMRPGSDINLAIETPLRCMARYFLTATAGGRETLRPGKASEVTAFLLATNSGFSFGLWSSKAGLFSEYAFLAPDEISRTSRGMEPSKPQTTDQVLPIDLGAYIKQAFDQLLLQMSVDKLESLQLSTFSQIIWATDAELSEAASPIVATFADKTGLEFAPLEVPLDEAVAGGLLLGSYSFGEIKVAGAEIVAPINLAQDIMAAADTEEFERYRQEEIRMQSRRSRAMLTVMAPPVIAAAFLLALALNLIVSNFITAWRESRADVQTVELKPALDRRKSYEANLKWYQEFITEVSQLRRQQPVGIGLLEQLNTEYPFTIDPAFYISEMRMTPTGDLEMKGLARNKDAIASFLKSLEFAGGAESGARLFANLAYEVQEVSSPTAAVQTQLPTLAGSTLGGIGGTAPGVVVWSIRGNYLPVAEFAPKPEGQPKSGAAPPSAPATAAERPPTG